MKIKFLVACLLMMIANSWASNKSVDSDQFSDAQSQPQPDAQPESDKLYSAKGSESGDDENSFLSDDEWVSDESVGENKSNSSSGKWSSLTSENLKQLQNELNQLTKQEETAKTNSETASFRTAGSASAKDYAAEDYLNEKNIEKKRRELKALIEKQEEARVKNPEATIKIDRNHVVATHKNDKNLGYRTVSLSEFFSQKPDAKAIMLRMIGRKGYSYASMIKDIDERLSKPNITEDEKTLLKKKRIELEQQYKEEEQLIKAHRSLQDDIQEFENKRVANATKVALFRNLRMKYGIFKPDENTKSFSEARSGKADQKALDNRILGVHADVSAEDDKDNRSFVSAESESEAERLQQMQDQRLKIKNTAEKIEQDRVNEVTPKVTEKSYKSWYNLTGQVKDFVKTGIEKFNIISRTKLNRNKKISNDTKDLDFNTRSLTEAIRGKPDGLAVNNRMLNKNALADYEKLQKIKVDIKDNQDLLKQYRNEPGSIKTQIALEKNIAKMEENKRNIEIFLSEHKELADSVEKFENDRVSKNIPTALFRNTRIALGIFTPKVETKSWSESLSGKADQKAIDNHFLGKSDKVYGLDPKKTYKNETDDSNLAAKSLEVHTPDSLEQKRKALVSKVKKTEQERLDKISQPEDRRSLFDVSGKVQDAISKYTKNIVFRRNARIKSGANIDINTRSLSEALTGKPDEQAFKNVILKKIDTQNEDVNKERDVFAGHVKEFEDHRVLNAERTVPFRNWRMKNNILKPDENTRSFSEYYTQRSDASAIERRMLGQHLSETERNQPEVAESVRE